MDNTVVFLFRTFRAVLISNLLNNHIMSRFYSIGMAEAVSQHTDLEIKKSFFGLFKSVYYLPTHSKVQSYEFYYDRLAKDDLDTVLNVADDKLAESTKHVKLSDVPNGNLKVELCLSQDRQFAAVRLYQFQNFLYRPLSEIRYFEGEVAQVIGNLFLSK